MDDEIVEGRTVLWSIGGVLFVGTAAACVVAGCLTCCFYSRRFRDFCGAFFPLEEEQNYRRLEENIPMRDLNARNGDEPGTQPGDAETENAPQPRAQETDLKKIKTYLSKKDKKGR